VITSDKGAAPVTVPSGTLELYEKLVATNPRVERKGATMPYTSLNGHMFSFLTNTGKLALRLPAEEREAFLKKYKTTLCEQHGSILKEYVEVPASLLKKTQELKKFFDVSYAYAASFKPKPTKKTKRAATNKASKKKTAGG
jgi:TfoX/Sxy family transcriptional regulator of competence genes